MLLVVALRKESVDRNCQNSPVTGLIAPVALRKESVDRNIPVDGLFYLALVALRKESVDRNYVKCRDVNNMP